MDVACPCLNVQIRVVSYEPVSDNQLEKYKSKDAFFTGGLARAQLVSLPLTRLGHWVSTRTVEDWRVKTCLLCNNDIMAYPIEANSHLMEMGEEAASHRPQPSPPIPVNILIPQSSFKHDMDEKMTSADYSQIFGVVLPQLRVIHVDDDTKKTNSPKSMSPSSESSLALVGSLAQSGPAQEIQSICSEYLRKEQESLDSRIRAFIDKEQAQFDCVRARVKIDRDRLLRDLQARSMFSDESSKVVGEDESANDSAVPLSPVSLPSVHMVSSHSPLRPKAYSNPASFKAGRSLLLCGPEMGIHKEEDVRADMFELDEDREPESPFMPIDDEPETDDSGAGDDTWQYYSDMTQPSPVINHPPKTRTEGLGRLVTKFGTSLPVSIPGRYWSPVNTGYKREPVEEDEECDSSDEEMQPQLEHLNRVPDVHVQMRALAKSIQAADDPERLFGERPQRRRYKTGENKGGPVVVVPQTVPAL